MAALLAFGCKDGGTSLEDAMNSITDDQLAIMVLPAEELGPDAAGLPVDPSAGAGFVDPQEWAESSIDPGDTAADVTGAGYVNGYELSYADYSGTSAVLEFDTAVFLFDTNDSASGGMAKVLDDLQASEGNDQYAHTNIVIEDDDSIGDEAKLLTANFAFDDEDGQGKTSAVFFRLGRLVAYASENRADDGDTATPSRAAAGTLEQRIKDVLRGDIQATPVDIPSEEEAAAIQIQGVLDQIADAFNNKDIDAYAGSWTDTGFIEGFGVSREEALQFLNESIGEPPIEFRNVSNVSFTENGADFEVDFIDGTAVKHARFSIIDEGNGPQIDGVEYLTTPVPPGATAVDLGLDDFEFVFDASTITDGNVAFEAHNDGQQPHEIVLEKVPEGIDLLQTFQDAFANDSDPQGVEFVAYVTPLNPGGSTNLVFSEPLAAGRYALLCFVPDANDPEQTPHAFQGMIGEFTVP